MKTITPVNKHILVKVVELDPYKKNKAGLIVPNAGITDTNGASMGVAQKTILTVEKIASDVTLDVKKGDELETWNTRLLYFFGEDGEKLALIKEESVAAVSRE